MARGALAAGVRAQEAKRASLCGIPQKIAFIRRCGVFLEGRGGARRWISLVELNRLRWWRMGCCNFLHVVLATVRLLRCVMLPRHCYTVR
jgi:hypothetical protein